jgi:LysM domain
MSALSSIGVPSGSDAHGARTTDFRGEPRLRVVHDGARPTARGRSAVAGGIGEPRSCSIPPVGRRPQRPGVVTPIVVTPVVLTASVLDRRAVRRTPIRLTRRGRAVAAALILAGLTIAALLATVLASGGAQATNHGQARAGYEGMHQIVVRSGQTLWSIASAAEPRSDTRIVVQEIMTANGLTGTTISAGQLLWVPR